MAAPVVRDQELELSIDSLAYGGNGVARLNGFVVFVRHGLPGDVVRARVIKVKRNHAEALAVEVLQPGLFDAYTRWSDHSGLHCTFTI